MLFISPNRRRDASGLCSSSNASMKPEKSGSHSFTTSGQIRERAYNGLMAVEEEAGNRKASYMGRKGLIDTRRESCIIATNLALGARRTFQFARTIEHDQTALKARDDSCPTSPIPNSPRCAESLVSSKRVYHHSRPARPHAPQICESRMKW